MMPITRLTASGKAEPFSALVVGIFLVAAAVAIMIESVHEIRTPHRLPAPYTLVVLAGVLLIKGMLSLSCRETARGSSNRKYGGSPPTLGDIHLSDAITSGFAPSSASRLRS